MKRVLILMGILTVSVMLSVIWIGCSETPTTTSSDQTNLADVTEYFPLNAGSSLYYMVTNAYTSDTAYKKYTVGNQVLNGETVVFSWSMTDMDYTNLSETGYVYVSDNSIFHYENSGDIPEKLLEAPFEIGNVWRRYTAPDDYYDDDGLATEDDGTGKDDDNGGVGEGNDDVIGGKYGDGNAKSYPSLGSNYFIVSALEDIKLDNGNSYDDCIKIENSTSTSTNCYWYAPGVGLVKYIQNINDETFPDGEVVGEIISTVNR